VKMRFKFLDRIISIVMPKLAINIEHEREIPPNRSNGIDRLNPILPFGLINEGNPYVMPMHYDLEGEEIYPIII
jgi:hypothetical protein